MYNVINKTKQCNILRFLSTVLKQCNILRFLSTVNYHSKAPRATLGPGNFSHLRDGAAVKRISVSFSEHTTLKLN